MEVDRILEAKRVNLDQLPNKENSYVCENAKTAIYSARISSHG
jgi:hypothetical protein